MYGILLHYGVSNATVSGKWNAAEERGLSKDEMVGAL